MHTVEQRRRNCAGDVWENVKENQKDMDGSVRIHCCRRSSGRYLAVVSFGVDNMTTMAGSGFSIEDGIPGMKQTIDNSLLYVSSFNVAAFACTVEAMLKP